MFSKKPLLGMDDFYPTDLRVDNWIIAKIKDVVLKYAYEEYESPLLEPIEIFEAKSSEELVNEQSFIVEKKKGKRLILRPELTPSLARMVAKKYMELEKPIRWFSNPRCWRAWARLNLEGSWLVPLSSRMVHSIPSRFQWDCTRSRLS